MDLEKLERDLKALAERNDEWHKPIRDAYERAKRLENQSRYTRADVKDAVRQVRYKQLLHYNPHKVVFPVREAMLAHYAETTSERRDEMRRIVWRNSYLAGVLLTHICDCAECLVGPEDGDVLRSGLIASALENHACGDFRDVGMVLSYLARAARKSGVDIISIKQDVIPLCAPYREEHMSTRSLIEQFETVGEHFFDAYPERVRAIVR